MLYLICLLGAKFRKRALKEWQTLAKDLKKEKEVIVYIRCRYCGAKTPETATNCANCGAKL